PGRCASAPAHLGDGVAAALVILHLDLVKSGGDHARGRVRGGRLIVPLVDDQAAVEEDADAVVGGGRERHAAAGEREAPGPADGEVVHGQPGGPAGAPVVGDPGLAGGARGGRREADVAEVFGQELAVGTPA